VALYRAPRKKQFSLALNLNIIKLTIPKLSGKLAQKQFSTKAGIRRGNGINHNSKELALTGGPPCLSSLFGCANIQRLFELETILKRKTRTFL
jgi:hypothetical protein